ncbi:DUF4843 domain-containing protein [Chitinophaga deserti]|uniref:DUF4843 domain-containing protein n=1 Tax=Chitinophaga deserti TaxID=2164099 RepID=UPI000D6ADA6A|nr:DUF4843 domain-containing protein [Chitinophaga deserti]
MKKAIQYTTLLFTCAFALGACEKSELVDYNQPDMIYVFKDFDSDVKDSASYSFAIKDESLQYDTVFVPVRIMGTAKDFDREVKWAPVDSLTTAVAGTDYEILPAKVPAGAFSANIPVKVLRNTAMKTNEVRLMVEIRQSKDFAPGISDANGSSWYMPGASRRYLVKINDFLTKPNNWDSFLKFFFDTFSQVKYAFIIKVTGRSEFPSGSTGLPYAQFVYYETVCRNALAEYEAANGPLIDEFGNRVTF